MIQSSSFAKRLAQFNNQWIKFGEKNDGSRLSLLENASSTRIVCRAMLLHYRQSGIDSPNFHCIVLMRCMHGRSHKDLAMVWRNYIEEDKDDMSGDFPELGCTDNTERMNASGQTSFVGCSHNQNHPSTQTITSRILQVKTSIKVQNYASCPSTTPMQENTKKQDAESHHMHCKTTSHCFRW